MAKVFSWKIAPGKYAYLEPEDGSYIRSRINDSTTIQQMANRIESWSEDEYRQAFDAMKAEVNRVYGTITGSYSDYYSVGGIGGGTVVLLAGKDGVDGKAGIADQYINETDYAELLAKINEEFDKYKAEIMSQVNAVRDSIENAASTDISEALDSLRQTREELSDLRDRLADASSKAQNAIDAVRGLSMFADGEIDPSILEDILLLESRFEEWATEYDGKILTLLSDYDSVTQQLGGIAIAMSTYEGQVSMMLENINAISGTVGTVEQTWAANSGLMRTLATWYDESASTYAEVVRVMDASRAAIEDIVNFYNGETTSTLKEYIDGGLAEMGRRIETISDTLSGTNHSTVLIEERLNGLSGIVSTAITRYDSLSGRVCTITEEMDAMNGSITQSLTVANDALQSARDMRDVWTQESGMLRSVTDLIIETDENGDPIYYYIDPDLPDHGDQSQWIRVYYVGDDPVTGLPIYNTAKDGSGTEYRDHVVPSYQAKMMSYILQNSNAIDLAVMSGQVISALRLSVDDSGSMIYMTADRVLIDSDVIAESLTAKAANVGGVHIGAGMISAQTGANKWALGSDGVLEATGAKVNGAITATSLTLGGGDTIEDYVTDRINSVSAVDATMVNGLISGYVSSQDFLTSDALSGYVDTETLMEWLAKQSGITSAYVQTIVNAMSGAQITSAWTESNGSGGTRHIIKIGDTDYTWDTWDGNDFLLLNTEYSGETDSGTARFLISKNGLLQANNAVIYGKIYASEGWFKGSVSADSGYFRGSVSANNGYFHGDIVANSLKLGNDTIQDYITDRLASVSGMDETAVNGLIADYLQSQDFLEGDALSGYVTTDSLMEWLSKQSGITSAYVQSVVNALSGSQITSAWTGSNGSGGTRHVIVIGGTSYSWDTWDLDGFVLLNTEYSGETESGTAKFLVTSDGLLQANNAIIYGKIYASEGWFKGSVSADSGYFRGSVSANNGYFHGDIVANSLKLGNNQTIDEFVNGKISSAMTSGLSPEMVNDIISDYLAASGDTILGEGYVTTDELLEYLAQQSGITSAYIQTIVNAMSGAQVTSAWTGSNGSGGTRHIIKIGDREYSWDTWDLDNFLLINTDYSGTTDSGTARFFVSTDGLLQANNAVIYGRVYANDGWFKGSVSADNGYFRGSVSADNGYFHGDIVANSLKLSGNKTIDEFVDGKIASSMTSGLSPEMVEEIISNYLEASGATILGDGYVTTDSLLEYLATQSGVTSAYVQTVVNAMSGAQITSTSSQPNGSGGTRHTITIGNTPYTWDTWDGNNYLLLNTTYSGETESGTAKFLVSRDGLLEANNAVVYGRVYASDGWFKGSISADSGYFRGSVSANNGYFKGSVSANNGYFSGTVYANSGSFKGAISATSLYLGSAAEETFDNLISANTSGIIHTVTMLSGGCVVLHDDLDDINEKLGSFSATVDSWGITDMGNYVELDHTVASGDTSVKVSKEGLLMAKNAIISGTVWASNGVFDGTVYARDGSFKGSVSADNGYFKGSVSANNGYFQGKIEANEGLIGGIKITSEGLSGTNVTIKNDYLFSDNVDLKGSISATNGYFRGKLESKDGYFKGSVSATNGYFSGTVYANSGKFSGDITANTLTLGGVEYGSMPSSLSSEDVVDIISQEATTNGWIKESDGYYHIGSPVGENFTVSTAGVLTAKNAILSGSVYATNGVFSGTVYATDGKFRGSISATSLVLSDNKSIDEHIDAAVPDDIIQLGHTYQYGSGANKKLFEVSTAGLLTAKNAVISGNVYANNGVFSGTVYATDGKFNGSVSANNGYFKGTVSATSGVFSGDVYANSLKLKNTAYVSGTVYATKGKFENITATTFSATNSFFSGTVYANEGNFKGSISADNGYFKGELQAATGSFKGSVSATNGYFSGSVYANSGSFKGSVSATNGFFSGTVYANKGSFSGAITATSLTLGGSTYENMPSSLSSGDVKNIISEEGYYRIGNPVANGSSSFTVTTGGLLTAKNAIISGSVYATNGVFNGKVYATGGEFSGAVKATSLQLGSTQITSLPDTSNMLERGVYYSAGTGANKKLFYVDNDGLLTAQNAVISGNVYATNGIFKGDVYADNGYFKGTVNAADVILDGHSLMLSSGASNTFEIKGDPITVDYIPVDVVLNAITLSKSQAPTSQTLTGWSWSNSFTATGASEAVIPQLNYTATWNFGSLTNPTGNVNVQVALFVASGAIQSSTPQIQSQMFANESYLTIPSLLIAGNSGGVITSVNNGSTGGTVSITGTTGSYTLNMKSGVTYVVGAALRVTFGSYASLSSYNVSTNKSTTIITPGTINTQFFKIGSNGFQLFLGSGFYLTAAKDGNGKPIIAMGGRKGNGSGAQFGLRLDKNGIMVLKGDGNSWSNITTS